MNVCYSINEGFWWRLKQIWQRETNLGLCVCVCVCVCFLFLSPCVSLCIAECSGSQTIHGRPPFDNEKKICVFVCVCVCVCVCVGVCGVLCVCVFVCVVVCVVCPTV